MLARKNNRFFYADSYGRPLSAYANLDFPDAIALVNSRHQQSDIVCGLYAVYYAWRLFSGMPIVEHFNDFELYAFIL